MAMGNMGKRSGCVAVACDLDPILMYAANFGSYDKTYGSLGTAIGFMTWMWLSFVVILIGAELGCRNGTPNRARHHDRTGMTTRPPPGSRPSEVMTLSISASL
jgi:hypothetical protein